MGRTKGGKNRKWSIEEKMRIIGRFLNEEGSLSAISEDENISCGMFSNWIKRYEQLGTAGLSRTSGNKFGGLSRKKNPTELELLEYENFKLKMEVELLKKGLDPERVMRIARKKKEKSSK